MLVVVFSCPFRLEILKEEHVRSSSTKRAGKPPYDLQCIGATKNQNKQKPKAKKS
jgi:hypothetical protein